MPSGSRPSSAACKAMTFDILALHRVYRCGRGGLLMTANDPTIVAGLSLTCWARAGALVENGDLPGRLKREDQAKATRVVILPLRRRRATPAGPKPMVIIAQAPGSGTAETAIDVAATNDELP